MPKYVKNYVGGVKGGGKGVLGVWGGLKCCPRRKTPTERVQKWVGGSKVLGGYFDKYRVDRWKLWTLKGNENIKRQALAENTFSIPKLT